MPNRKEEEIRLFMSLYNDHCRSEKRKSAAYDKAEEDFKKKTGRRAYANNRSFRSAKAQRRRKRR